MGTIVLHVGMPKTGTTSLQTWLGAHAADLLREHDIAVVHEVGRGGEARLEHYRGGLGPASLNYCFRYDMARRASDASTVSSLARTLMAELDRMAGTSSRVVMTSEALAPLLYLSDEAFLASLGELAESHRVVVALYVRPQDGALEARWRQWGYSSDLAPSAWIRVEAEHLRHRQAYEGIGTALPHVDLVVRPFVRDLLVGGDVITDFADQVLGIGLAEPARLNANPTLPLDLAILLRRAPADVLKLAADGAMGQMALSELAQTWNVPESDEARRSREVLRGFATQEFEADNRLLADALGWPIDEFVPAPPPGPYALEELDDLWSPRASPTELEFLYCAIRELVDAERSRR